MNKNSGRGYNIHIPKQKKDITKYLIPDSMIAAITKRYPQAIPFLKHGDENRTEVVFELFRDPLGRFGHALALIGLSLPHWHDHTWETYTIIEGSLNFFDGTSHGLTPLRMSSREGLFKRQPHVIYPGTHHWAEAAGKPALVHVVSTPAWSAKDHHLSKSVPRERIQRAFDRLK